MTDTPPPKRKPGRPPAEPGASLDDFLGLRVETALKRKCEEGGNEWVRATLRKAPLLKKAPKP
ncbi:hypothetical protein [Rhodoferax sp.]|uniref:hypothetical protein n=1 Tax=Rhodoferax sp. TaxID=50421 RepID=UPI00374CDF5A